MIHVERHEIVAIFLICPILFPQASRNISPMTAMFGRPGTINQAAPTGQKPEEPHKGRFSPWFDRLLLIILPILLIVSPVALFVGGWKLSEEGGSWWPPQSMPDVTDEEPGHSPRARSPARYGQAAPRAAGSGPESDTDFDVDPENGSCDGERRPLLGRPGELPPQPPMPDKDKKWWPRLLFSAGVCSSILTVGIIGYEFSLPSTSAVEAKYVNKIHQIQKEISDVEHEITEISRGLKMETGAGGKTAAKTPEAVPSAATKTDSEEKAAEKEEIPAVAEKEESPVEKEANKGHETVTIKETHDENQDQHAKLAEAGHKTRFSVMDKSELAEYLKERSKDLSVPLSEHSQMVQLVDAKNVDGDRLRPGVLFPGFSTSQSVGMADDGENPDLAALSEELGVKQSDLDEDTVASLWGPRVGDLVHRANPDRTFELEVDGKGITEDERDELYKCACELP